jgi:hypothetical protein
VLAVLLDKQEPQELPTEVVAGAAVATLKTAAQAALAS